ncbi:IS66 family insertion sequence element accessory protein TnpB, partial [Oligella sp. HMSC09E12]
TKAIQCFGQVAPHEAYVFMNRTHTLLKLLMHDALGSWLCVRRLHEGRFHGAGSRMNPALSAEQLQALALGLPWHRLGEAGIYRYC